MNFLRDLRSDIDVSALAKAGLASAVALLVVRIIDRPAFRGILSVPPEVLGIPQGTVAALLANFKSLPTKRLNAFKEMSRWANGRTVSLPMAGMRRIVVHSACDIEHVMVGNGYNYVKVPQFALLLGRALGHGLVTEMNDELHTTHRRLISPAFSPVSIRRISNDVMRHHAMDMLRAIGASCSEDKVKGGSGTARVVVQDVVHRAALNIIAEAAFHTTGVEELNEVNECFQQVRVNLTIHPLHFTAIGRALSPALRAVDAAKRRFDKFVTRTSERFRAEECGTVEGSGKTIFDYLLHAPGLTASDLRDHAVTFMFAGFDTSSNTLQWTLALLATHPSVQQRLFEELCPVIGRGTVPEIDDLKKCVFLDAVIREGMRMYTVVPAVARLALEDDVLPDSKVVIPAGSTVMIPLHGLHYLKDVYGDDADEFHPERWLDAALRDRAASRYAFLPFSLGRRHCIGKDFAWNELTTLLAVLARNFSFELAPGESFPTMMKGNLLTTADPYALSMRERQD